MSIIITVPHAACSTNVPEDRKCDRRAEEAALVLSNNLGRRGITYWVQINAEVERCVCSGKDCRGTSRTCIDMNRKKSRRTSWRRDLTRLLLDRPDWVVDIHSFPWMAKEDKLSFGLDTLVVLLVEEDTLSPEISEMYSKLVELLGKDSALVFRGKDNDILIQANKLGIKSVLIEVHEDETALSKDTLEQTMDVVASILAK